MRGRRASRWDGTGRQIGATFSYDLVAPTDALQPGGLGAGFFLLMNSLAFRSELTPLSLVNISHCHMLHLG